MIAPSRVTIDPRVIKSVGDLRQQLGDAPASAEVYVLVTLDDGAPAERRLLGVTQEHGRLCLIVDRGLGGAK